MFKFVAIVLLVSVCVSAKPGLVAPLAYTAPVVAAPAVVTAQSSQVIARNYNGYAAAPLVAAPLVAAAPVVKAVAAPLVASAPVVKAVAAPLAAAPLAYTAAAPFAAAPLAYAASPYVASPYAYAPNAYTSNYVARAINPFGYSAPLTYAATVF